MKKCSTHYIKRNVIIYYTHAYIGNFHYSIEAIVRHGSFMQLINANYGAGISRQYILIFTKSSAVANRYKRIPLYHPLINKVDIEPMGPLSPCVTL